MASKVRRRWRGTPRTAMTAWGPVSKRVPRPRFSELAKTTTIAYRHVLERLSFLVSVPGCRPATTWPGSALRRSAPGRSRLHRPAPRGPRRGLTGARPAVGAGREATLLGHLFESLVTFDVRVYARAAENRVGHLRSQGGNHEIDLIVGRGDGKVVAFKVELAASTVDADVQHLTWLRGQLGDGLLDTVVITAGKDAYRRRDRIAVVPAALLGP